MFDLITGSQRRDLTKQHPMTLLISIVVHAVLVVVVVVLPALYATDQLPPLPVMMVFASVLPAPPPPPPPPPPASARSEPVKQLVENNDRFAAPIEAPREILPESGLEPNAAGVEGGVEGGVPGGIVGGIVGGLGTAPPPPPPPPAAPPAPVERTPIRVGGNIKTPALLIHPDPVYPDIAVAAKVSGIVILEAQVGVDGCVQSVKVLRSDSRLLEGPAITAVKQWQYSPLMLNGRAEPFVLTVTLSFFLKRPS